MTLEALARAGGWLMIGAMVLSIASEFGAPPLIGYLSGAAAFGALAAFTPTVAWGRRAFPAVGLVLTLWAVVSLPDWRDAILSAVVSASFIAGLFTALTAIRTVATDSHEIVACGRFLAAQPPGRRYATLTLGGQLFGLFLFYGSIALLGALAKDAAAQDGDDARRAIRERRMLLAIQRGFLAILTWSPLSFSMAITVTLVPGASWAAAAPFGVVSTLIFAATGWALDAITKPTPSGAPPLPLPDDEGWLYHLRPLAVLLTVIVAAAAALHFAFGARIVGAVMLVVPVVAVLWEFALAGERPEGRRAATLSKIGGFITRDIPAYRAELTILVMAGYIGTLGAALSRPILEASGIDLTAIPGPLLVVILFWTVPILGQLGMNPILAVSLLTPLLPAAGAVGLSPTAMIVAITGGWALSGFTSPFTASVLLVAQFGGVSAARVGLGWNGLYALVSGVLVSIWAVSLAFLL